MQIASVRTAAGSRAARVDGDDLVVLPVSTDELLMTNQWDLAATDAYDGASFERVPRATADLAPLIGSPDKIICVGLNYHDHIREMGNTVPAHPTYFSKFRGALIGANDDIHLPGESVSTSVDWEVELCIVIGRAGRHIAVGDALDHIAGYTVFNDVSVRDWQRRTSQFLAGKTFEHTTPVGPVMTTTDELGDGRGLAVSSAVNGQIKQQSNTNELVFGPAELIADLSTVITLLPGDLIATGTPGGVGAARTPPEWLHDGAEVVTEIEGIGELRNRCVLCG